MRKKNYKNRGFIMEENGQVYKQCNYEGITKGSISQGVMFAISDGFLSIGTDSDNYLVGRCATYEKFIDFNIENASLVTVFRLAQVKFDDYLQLKFNGNIVYVGPDGGDYIEIRDRKIEIVRAKVMVTEVFNGYEYRSCERGANWDKEVSIDLKPYLNTGENTLEMKLLVSGMGEGWLKIEAKQQCCGESAWAENHD